MSEVRYALSVRQPWATLLVQGLKSIEVRSWWVPRSGRILIHAARIVDTRPEAWRHVPRALRAEAEEAIAGGAAIIDVKEPDRGPLGRADAFTALEVIRKVNGRRLVSVALGELAECSHESVLEWLRVVGPGVTFGKLGLASISF